MIRDLVSYLDYSICAELALAAFVGAFVAILYGTARLSRSASERFAAIPLDDHPQEPQQ